MGADFFRNHHIIATWKTLSAAQSFDQGQYRWLKGPNAIVWDGQSSEPMSSIVTQWHQSIPANVHCCSHGGGDQKAGPHLQRHRIQIQGGGENWSCPLCAEKQKRHWPEQTCWPEPRCCWCFGRIGIPGCREQAAHRDQRRHSAPGWAASRRAPRQGWQGVLTGGEDGRSTRCNSFAFFERGLPGRCHRGLRRPSTAGGLPQQPHWQIWPRVFRSASSAAVASRDPSPSDPEWWRNEGGDVFGSFWWRTRGRDTWTCFRIFSFQSFGLIWNISNIATWGVVRKAPNILRKFRKVYSILRDHKYDVLMVAADAGESFADLTTKYLGRLHREQGTMLAVCTKHYGEMTDSAYSSHKELKFALDYEKFVRVLPLKVEDTYPPQPPGGPGHKYDKEFLAQSYILSVFKPGLVRLDCQDKSEIDIAVDIATNLQKYRVATRAGYHWDSFNIRSSFRIIRVAWSRSPQMVNYCTIPRTT